MHWSQDRWPALTILLLVTANKVHLKLIPAAFHFLMEYDGGKKNKAKTNTKEPWGKKMKRVTDPPNIRRAFVAHCFAILCSWDRHLQWMDRSLINLQALNFKEVSKPRERRNCCVRFWGSHRGVIMVLCIVGYDAISVDEGIWCLYIQGISPRRSSEVQHSWTVHTCGQRNLWSFKMSRTTHPLTQHSIAKYLHS